MGMTAQDHFFRRKDLRKQRWKALRLKALRRDKWRCKECGARRRLEVDHIKSRRTHPELAWELSNLQVLCASCHTRKTRKEYGRGEVSPERKKWQELLSACKVSGVRLS